MGSCSIYHRLTLHHDGLLERLYLLLYSLCRPSNKLHNPAHLYWKHQVMLITVVFTTNAFTINDTVNTVSI